MQCRIWKFFLKKRNNSQILNNKSVDWIIFKIRNILNQPVNFFIMKRNVQCAVKFFSGELLFKLADFFIFIFVKIVRLHTQRKIFQSNVNSIGSVNISVLKFFNISSRRKKFHILFHRDIIFTHKTFSLFYFAF